jgi:hypothetical protein
MRQRRRSLFRFHRPMPSQPRPACQPPARHADTIASPSVSLASEIGEPAAARHAVAIAHSLTRVAAHLREDRARSRPARPPPTATPARRLRSPSYDMVRIRKAKAAAGAPAAARHADVVAINRPGSYARQRVPLCVLAGAAWATARVDLGEADRTASKDNRLTYAYSALFRLRFPPPPR